MMEYDTADLVLCHLLEVRSDGDAPGDRNPGAEAAFDRSVPGIAAALDLDDESVAERIELLSAISTLQREGMIVETVGPVRGLGGDRNRYHLTESGRRRARSVVEDVAEATVTVAGTDDEWRTSVESAAAELADGSVASLLSKLDADGRLNLVEPTEGEFVDREAELDRLAAALDAVEDDAARTVAVTGPAGIGKTELVSAFRDRILDGDPDSSVSFASGSADRDAADPYGPYRALLADLGVDPGELELLGSRDRTGAPPDTSDDLRARRRAAFEEVGGRIVEGGPVVAFVDDVHRADSATVRLTEHLASEVDGGLLLVVAGREGGVGGDDGAGVDGLDRLRELADERIDLTGLDREATRAHVEWLVGRRDVPDEFVASVQEATGGNPLFVRETVSRAVREGELDPARGISPDPDSVGVPDSVRRTVEERLQGLDDAATELVRLGAVVGRFVPRELLVAAAPVDPAAALDYADLLEEGRVWRREPDRDGYRFTSGVVREAVLERTDESRRRDLHRRVAESILEVYRDDPGEWFADVADHFEAAGDADRALEYHRKAAERAEDVYATDVARDAYESALELARELGATDRLLEFLESIGEIEHLAGELEAAERRFEYVRERTDDPDAAARTWTQLSRIALHRGDHGEAVERAERGLSTVDAETPDADLLRSDLLSRKGWALLQQGEFDDAARAFERERDLVSGLDDDWRRGRAAHDLGTLRLKRGRWEEARPLLEEAVRRHEADDDSHPADALTNLGVVHWKLGELDAAAQRFERALEHQRKLNDERGRLSTLTNLGLIHQHRGDLDRALDHYERSLEAARRVGDKRSTGILLSNVGSIRVNRLNLGAAEEALAEAVELTEAIDNPQGLGTALGNRARLRLFREEYEAALADAGRRAEIAEDLGDPEGRARALGLVASVHHERGDAAAAERAARERSALARERDLGGQRLSSAGQLARILADSGDVDGARETLATAEECGDPGTALGEIRLDLARGVVAAAGGDHDRAMERYREAIADSRDLGHAAMECWTRLRAAESLIAVGDPDSADEHLRAVLETCEGTGATLFEGDARDLLERSRDER